MNQAIAAHPDERQDPMRHLAALDGWRAISILAVLAGHWVPLGPKAWRFNEAVPALGMALFFTLSGFLIVSLLLRDSRLVPFLIRRLFRIVPLAWLAITILVVANATPVEDAMANYLFYANLPPARLLDGGHHLWSLCVEVQFYAAMALLVAVFGRRGLLAVPILLFVVTVLRMIAGETISIVTWHRVDEILAGGTLALIYTRKPALPNRRKLPSWLPLVALAAALLASHPASGPFGYLRPYLAAAAVGTSLYSMPEWLAGLLGSAPARYVANISYALYVIHGMLGATWLGGETASKSARYARRPLLIAATFVLAHLSTRYYERRWIEAGKALSRRSGNRAG